MTGVINFATVGDYENVLFFWYFLWLLGKQININMPPFCIFLQFFFVVYLPKQYPFVKVVIYFSTGIDPLS